MCCVVAIDRGGSNISFAYEVRLVPDKLAWWYSIVRRRRGSNTVPCKLKGCSRLVMDDVVTWQLLGFLCSCYGLWLLLIT